MKYSWVEPGFTFFTVIIPHYILFSNNACTELLDSNMGVQLFTVAEGDHVGVERIEVLFFTLYVRQTVGRRLCPTQLNS